MSAFLQNIGTELSDLFTFLVTVALLQNIILTAGFGSSLMLRIVRTPKKIWAFSGILAFFSIATVLVAYPLDRYFGTAITNYWRPLMMVGITVVLYVLVALLLQALASNFYNRISGMLPLAAFNTLVTGIALVCNLQFSSNLGGNIGLAVGACLGFALFTWLIAEGIERLDNPDMPEAFRGMPATLVYTGLLALALMGFTSNFALI